MRLTVGTRAGAYEIGSSLGAGGLGEVYRARDTRLNRDVAVAVLSASVAAHPDALARLERDARTLASLDHPRIGAIYALERVSPGGTPPEIAVLVFELVEGETLADRVGWGPIPLADALEMARQIAEALEVAHERGIVHRHLRPAHVKIVREQAVKVVGFELALADRPDPGGSVPDPTSSPTLALEGSGKALYDGTAAYTSPEQLRGRPVDKRADIWAFACVLYELLAREPAFKGSSPADTIAAVLEREPDVSRLPPSTPAGIRLLIRRCLQKDPRRRLRDIADARMDLDDAIAQPAARRAGPAAGSVRARPTWQTASLVGVCLVAAGGAGWLGARRQPADTAPAFGRMIRFVSTAAHEFAPIISPDGKWVAYLSDARGPTDVWVKFIAGGDPVNLTASADVTVQSADGIGGLAVSPDGSQIAFQGRNAVTPNNATWVMPAPLGGVPHRLLPAGSAGMQWSPDGKRIAYVKAGGPLGDALAVSDADGQNAVEILERQGDVHAHWPQWDPAGQFVYYNYGAANNAEPTEIFRVPAAGGPPERVVATTRRAVTPFPSPDGRGLFYAANPDSVDLGLWWTDLTGRRVSRLTTAIGEYSAPSLSADGRRMVGTVREIRQSLERVQVVFDRAVTPEPLTDGYSGDIDPDWAPDGSRIVFSSARTGSRTIWTARADLSRPSPLTSGAVLDERPAYSPDGRHVAFVSDRGGRRGIWLVGTDAGAPRPVAAADVLTNVTWSPDGRRLLFSARAGGAPGLMIVDVATGQTSRVPTEAAATSPAWSPRGDVIAYIEPREAAGAYLKFVTASGQPPPLHAGAVLKEPLGNGLLAWSPDGRRLAVASWLGAASTAIWIVEPAGRTPPRKLLDLPAGIHIRGLTWSRDGASLIVGRSTSSGDIFLAERSAAP